MMRCIILFFLLLAEVVSSTGFDVSNDNKSREDQSELKQWTYYETGFHPREYLEKYYGKTNATPKEGGGFTDKSLSEIFSKISRNLSAPSRILEIGTGPSLLLAIYAGEVFDEIYLSDYASINRDELRRSIDGAADVFDWSARLDYIRRCNISIGDNAVEILKTKVKSILHCNIRIPGAISVDIPQLDAVAALLVLESATETFEEYQNAVKNVVELLKPSGFYIQSGMFNQTYYNDGAATYFRTYPVIKDQVLETLSKNGIKIIDFYDELYERQNATDGGALPDDDSVGYYIVYGIKEQSVVGPNEGK